MTFTVKGTVKSSNSEYFSCVQFSDLNVFIYEAPFSSTPAYLDSTGVNNDGTFSKDVTTTAKAILLRLYSGGGGTGGGVLLSESPKFCPHDGDITIDFDIDESKTGDPVFETVVSRLSDAGATTAETISALTDDQITELACMTCVTEKTLKRLRLAYSFWDTFAAMTPPDAYSEAETAMHDFVNAPDTTTATDRGRKIFFALLQGKAGNTVDEVFTYSHDQFSDAIQKSIDANEIDNTLNSTTNLDYLDGTRNALLLNSDNDERYYDAKLIHLSDNTYSDKNDLLNRVLDGGGLTGIIGPDGTNDDPLVNAMLVRTLNTHLLNFVPFLKAVIDDRGADPDYFNMTTLGPDDLQSLMTSSALIPDNFADAASYANAIYSGLGDTYPSARMIYALSGAGSSIPSGSDISTALNAHQDFNINEHSAAAYFTTETGHPNSIDPDVLDNMLVLQRTSRLTGDTNSLDNVTTLIGANLTSSSAIVNLGEEMFMRTMGATGMMSDDTAGRIFQTARGINEAASFMMSNYLRYEGPNARMPRVLSNSLTLPGGSLPSGLPDMQTLFGSMNTCTCEECQSVYSAAAYLVDLLNWLRKDVVKPSPSTTTGFNALETMGSFDRRKDIRYIELSCQNTNTLIPYIDIVNEIFSVELLADALYTPTQITLARKSLQTLGTTDQIMTEPEHRFHDAENFLKNYFYTWVLPYNVAYDEVMSYMKISGLEYNQMITAFSNASLKHDEIRWARTALNIHPEELSMYTSVNSGSTSYWLNYWGFSGAVPVPPYVGPVLNTTGLTVEELKDELNAYYINGTTKVEVEPVDDLCDVDSYTFSPSLTAARAERLMKLFRLRRRAGLGVWELDVAIQTLSGTGIDNAFLQKLAACVSFTKDYNISFSDLMVMLGDNAYADLITPTDFSEYYKDKFLDVLLPDDIRTFFNTTLYSTTVAALTNQQKQYFSTIFKVSIPAINQIISNLGLTGTFTQAMLAAIHRHALLMNVFGISYAELASSITFFGDIFGATNKIKKAYEFSEALTRFRMLDVPLLKFMDIANGTGDYTLTALDSNAEKCWTSVEKAFQEARKANADKDATDVIWLPFYRAVLVQDLALQFNLLDADVEDLVSNYSGTWFSGFIADPDGTGTARTWPNKQSVFAPVHRLLNRIVILCDILGIEKTTVNDLERQSLDYGIETEIGGTMNVPGTEPFYWLKSNYTALTATSLSELVWIKNASRHAAALDMPQRDEVNVVPVDLYKRIDHYFTNNASYVIGTGSPIYDMYDELGANSVYKQLSVHEFSEIFVRAKSIASGTTDILAVMDAFERIYYVIQVFNIKAADAWAWVWDTGWSGGTFTATTVDYTMSADVKRAIHSVYPVFSDWSNVIVPVQNELRARMRDAFVGLYIAQRGFADENALYDYYLLDTQMSPCMKTSRIVQAIASVQLLVSRGLLNLEPDVYMDENDKQEWEWRKNYRVWEANRKVFLYPENWIDPTLRKNKTELFKAAEDLLQQDEINDRNCEQAYFGYLTGLNDVAHLDVRAVYVEDPEADLSAGQGMVYRGTQNEIYHVFARNWNPPYTYYYRKFSGGVWNGWEKMDVEIDSDHLIPVMFNRKIYLFFPLFTEKIYNNTEANKYFEIQLAYTKYDFGKWSQKKVFKEKIYAAPTCFLNYDPQIDEPVPSGLTGFTGRFWDHDNYRNNLGNNYFSTWYDNFALASMKKNDFYFWAENLSDGGLKIHIRRAFDKERSLNLIDSYTEFAYEKDFVLNPVDERVQVAADGEFYVIGSSNRFFLARPNMTIPFFQQLKFGKAKGNVAAADLKMCVKNVMTYNPAPVPLLSNASDYILTYPQQYKHSVTGQPFFFKHAKRSYFFRYKGSFNPNFAGGTA